MDLTTIAAIVGGIIIAVLLSAWMVSRMMSAQYAELYTMLHRETVSQQSAPKVETKSKGQKTSAAVSEAINEEEVLNKLRKVIDEKVKIVLDEAKHRKERLLTLLDIARGYTLGYVTIDEYNAFLIKILNELNDFKRLWLARFPSSKDKEQLDIMINYVARTKLPIEVRTKDKNTIKLSSEEALI